MLLLFFSSPSFAEDGYRLWLRYDKINNTTLLQHYRSKISSIHILGNSPTLRAAKHEMLQGLHGLLDKSIKEESEISNGPVLVGTKSSPGILAISPNIEYNSLGDEGFSIQTIRLTEKNITLISGNTDIAAYKYNEGVQSVQWMQATWSELSGLIDKERHKQVKMLLIIQEKEAIWWRDECLSYFQTFSKKPIPKNYEQPAHPLNIIRLCDFLFHRE